GDEHLVARVGLRDHRSIARAGDEDEIPVAGRDRRPGDRDDPGRDEPAHGEDAAQASDGERRDRARPDQAGQPTEAAGAPCATRACAPCAGPAAAYPTCHERAPRAASGNGRTTLAGVRLRSAWRLAAELNCMTAR